MPAPRIIGLPSLYVQGPGLLPSLPARLVDFGWRRAAAVHDPVVGPAFRALAGNGTMHWEAIAFGGQCTQAEVDRLCTLATRSAPDVIVGAGGGQALDTAKAVALRLELPLAIVPTAASSDAPTSRLIALYDEDHKIAGVPLMRRNPDLVFVDTSILAQAPRRLLAAGIGDAFTKRYEVADAGRDPNRRNYFGGLPPHLATVLAAECHATLLRDAASALADVGSAMPGPAFERIVEATILYSGLAFESGGLSVAHGMLRGLTAFAQTRNSLHGELVSYGLLVQLHAFDYPSADIAQATRFLADCGLPVSRRQIGLGELGSADLHRIATLTLAAPYLERLVPALKPECLVAAMEAVELRATHPTTTEGDPTP